MRLESRSARAPPDDLETDDPETDDIGHRRSRALAPRPRRTVSLFREGHRRTRGPAVLSWLLAAGCGGADHATSSHGDAKEAPPPLMRLDLVDADAPGTARGPRPVALNEELRAAWELDADTRLVGELHATPAGVLRFGFGLSALPRRGGRPDPNLVPLKLHLSILEGETAVHEEVFSFPTGGSRKAHWKDARIPLAELPAGRLRAVFRIDVLGKEGVVAAIASPRVERPGEGAPTVVLVTSDTHRADHLGALGEGGAGLRTPALDRLAQRGVLFEDCFATTNFTVPSHVALMTALPGRDTGVVSNTMGLVDGGVTLAEVFRDSGYATLAVASVVLLQHKTSGLGQGFDRMHAPLSGEVPATTSIEVLERWLAEVEGLPAFAWLHVYDAHAPYEPPEELERLYYPTEADPGRPTPGQPEAFGGVPWSAEIRDFEFVVAQYKSEVTHLDAQLQRFFALPRLSDAVIAFTADHGEVLHGHGIFFNHFGLFPDTLAVPLIVVWPDAPAGRRVGAPVGHVDLGRTLLDLAGLRGADFPGRSLTRWLAEAAPDPEPRFALSADARSASIEMDGWMLQLWLADSDLPARVAHQVELYDLERDPACTVDLVNREDARARELRGRLVEWLSVSPAPLVRGGGDDPELQRELAALGYGGEGAEAGAEAWYRPDPRSGWCRRFEDG